MMNQTIRCLMFGILAGVYGATMNSATSRINSRLQNVIRQRKNDPSVHTDGDVMYWEEECSSSPFSNDKRDIAFEEKKNKDEMITKSRSSLISFSRESDLQQQLHQKRKQIHEVSMPHPLRTDEWHLTLNWRFRKHGHRRSQWYVEFHTNRFARVKETNHSSDDTNSRNSFFGIGCWDLLPNGKLILSLPYNEESTHPSSQIKKDDNKDEKHFSFNQIILLADLHQNPFGLQPKLSRGIIIYIPSKRSWLRPIIATFTANGVGKDTADFSYQSRH
jgi:hypothetical protein